jgi:hypothetical protein
VESGSERDTVFAEDDSQSDEDINTGSYAPSLSPELPATPSYPSTPPKSQSRPTPNVPNSSKETSTKEAASSEETQKSKRKIVASAIRDALGLAKEAEDLGQKPKGLLGFFKKGTQEERDSYFAREDERAAEIRSQARVDVTNVYAKKKIYERELARQRQQKKRRIQKEQEIRHGVRSPGGTKRKVSCWLNKNKAYLMPTRRPS